MTAPRFASWLGWALLLAAILLDDTDTPQAPRTAPCGTDQECAEANPGARGAYAFPEKGKP